MSQHQKMRKGKHIPKEKGDKTKISKTKDMGLNSE